MAKEFATIQTVSRMKDAETKMHANSPRLVITIEGLEVVGMCDTGSEVSFINLVFYEKHLRPRGVKVNPTNTRIKAIGG